MSVWVRYGELVALFLLHGMALSMWFVPLSTILDANDLHAIKAYAFATAAIGSAISPLIFGAIADRHAGPVRVLRWLAVGTALAMALASTAIRQHWNAWLVVALIQLHSLLSAPTWSISTAIVFARLERPRQQFGPLRAMATLGWMMGCWIVSAAKVDSSPTAGYLGALTWLAVAALTTILPGVAPIPTGERLTWGQRLGWDALALLKHADHRAVFMTVALFTIPLAAFYPYTPPHLRDLGLVRTSAWMSLGQITEIIAMLGLARLLGSFRIKWMLLAGLTCGLLRYVLCAWNEVWSVLLGISLHGFSYTLSFIIAQIYLEERVDHAWRARAQALITMLSSGLGNLIGYLAAGGWLAFCTTQGLVRWPLFWGVLAAAVGAVLIYFFFTYRGRAGTLAVHGEVADGIA